MNGIILQKAKKCRYAFSIENAQDGGILHDDKKLSKYLRKGSRCFPVAKDSTSELVRLSSDRSRPHSSDQPASQTVFIVFHNNKIFPGAKEKD
jgi:hypothetical protein